MGEIPYNRIPNVKRGSQDISTNFLSLKPSELITTKTVSTDMSIPFWMKIESTYKPK